MRGPATRRWVFSRKAASIPMRKSWIWWCAPVSTGWQRGSRVSFPAFRTHPKKKARHAGLSCVGLTGLTATGLLGQDHLVHDMDHTVAGEHVGHSDVAGAQVLVGDHEACVHREGLSLDGGNGGIDRDLGLEHA